MDGFELDYDAMRRAQDQLGRLREILEQQRDTAMRLPDSVPMSTAPIHDPVADKLHEVYLGRADEEGGVQALLEEYIEELDDIQLIIDSTLAAYVDADALRGVQGPSGEVH